MGHEFNALSCNVRDCQRYTVIVAVHAPPMRAPLQVKRDHVQDSCSRAYFIWLELITARYYPLAVQQAHPLASRIAGLLL